MGAAQLARERGRILQRAAQLLRERNDELAQLETLQHRQADPGNARRRCPLGRRLPRVLRRACRAASPASISISVPPAFGYTRREPLGVVAGIGAWNYPLQIACWKSAPALACGNAMIFKPAELTPLTALKLAEIYREAGLPAGVFKVVQGLADTGRLLTRHPADPQGLAHRRGRHRQGGDGRCGLDAQAGHAGARRQVAADRVRGCQARRTRSPGRCSATSIPPAKCAPTARASSCTRACEVRSSNACARASRHMKVGDPLDPATQVGALISAGAHGEGARLHRARPRRGRAPADRRHAGHGGGAGARASSSRRRCSTAAATTWTSCARRSSGR